MGGAYCAQVVRKAWRKVRAKWLSEIQPVEKYRLLIVLALLAMGVALGGSCRAATFLPGEPGRPALWTTWPANCAAVSERTGAEKPMSNKFKELARMANRNAGQDLRAGQQGLPGAALYGARF
ncbi:MAG: hypothetical protein ACREEY_00110 [Brevundimonas sp.]